MIYRAVVLDVDGVLIVPEEPFSWRYARGRGLDKGVFRPFFQGPFQDALVGKADLKELLEQNLYLWQWTGSVDELMQQWFDSEHVPNPPMMSAVKALNSCGVACYFATNQEKYRGQYMRSVVFDDGMFDGDYISADIGLKKPDPRFFQHILNDLQAKHPGITPQEILFVDDTAEHVQSAKSLGFDARHYTEQSATSVQQLINNITN